MCSNGWVDWLPVKVVKSLLVLFPTQMLLSVIVFFIKNFGNSSQFNLNYNVNLALM